MNFGQMLAGSIGFVGMCVMGLPAGALDLLGQRDRRQIPPLPGCVERIRCSSCRSSAAAWRRGKLAGCRRRHRSYGTTSRTWPVWSRPA